MRANVDIAALALAKACHVHGNTKPSSPSVTFDDAIASVKRKRDAFTIEDLKYNVHIKPGAFKQLFGKLAKSTSFPSNLRDIYAEAYSLPSLPNCAPWREYLLTTQEAAIVYTLVTKKGKHDFLESIRDGAIPCYTFTAYNKRFRAEDIHRFIFGF